MALAIDGGTPTGITGTGGSNGNAQTTLATAAGYTLSNAGDISLVAIGLEKEAAGIPSTASLTDGTNNYTLRNRLSYSIASTPASQITVEWWWAYSPTTLTNATVTATCTGGGGFTNGVLMAFGVTGFTGINYQTNPWDQSAVTALGWGADSTSLTASAIVSNSYSNVSANAMLIGLAGTSSITGIMDPGDTCVLAGATTSSVAAANASTFGNLVLRFEFAALTVAATDTGTAQMSTGRTFAGWSVLPDILAQAGAPVQPSLVFSQQKIVISVTGTIPMHNKSRRSPLIVPRRPPLIVPPAHIIASRRSPLARPRV